mgnify:FL=1
MRKLGMSLNEVKDKIRALKGANVTLAINRGRKKIDRFQATVENIYPSVFTVKVDQINQLDTQTFSYFDVLCGDVEILSISWFFVLFPIFNNNRYHCWCNYNN